MLSAAPPVLGRCGDDIDITNLYFGCILLQHNASPGFAGSRCEDEIAPVNIVAAGRYNTPNNYFWKAITHMLPSIDTVICFYQILPAAPPVLPLCIGKDISYLND